MHHLAARCSALCPLRRFFPFHSTPLYLVLIYERSISQMSVGFGFSVGDFIAVIELVATVIMQQW